VKEVLLKFVVQVLQSYRISIFLLIKSLCARIQNDMNKFFWCSGGGGKGIKWISWERMCILKKFRGMGFRLRISWERMCILKKFRGMGFRSPCEFNLALLAK